MQASVVPVVVLAVSMTVDAVTLVTTAVMTSSVDVSA